MSEPIDAENPTDEEHAAIEAAWRRGDPLPAGWIVVELPATADSGVTAGMAPNGIPIAPGTHVILRESWLARGYAGQLGDDS